MSERDRPQVGVALDGAGWHPAAWRADSSRPSELFDAAYWVDVVGHADRGGLDFVTIDDSLALQSSDPFNPDERTDEVRGRLDALLIAARVAPTTERIGLIPVVTTTHTEPFHVSKAVATLDYVSSGRAGWQPRISHRRDEADQVGRRSGIDASAGFEHEAVRAAVGDLFDEAADAVEVTRRLWDSWEDDAEIRDPATDRFLDRAKVHTVDFVGTHFSVRGPSITPRPPQGQPVVAALAHAAVPYRFAARSADLVFVTPLDDDGAAQILVDIAEAESRVERTGEPLHVLADVVVFLDRTSRNRTSVDHAEESGADRLARLDALGLPLRSDARIFTGSADELADLISGLHSLGYAGVRLRPGVTTDDLPLIVEELLPRLRGADAADRRDPTSLRATLGLPTAVPNRYAESTAASSSGADR